MNKMNQNGRSMVEMLGVLAIIGVLSAGGLAGYSKAMYKYRVNETMNQLTMIVSNIRTLFGSQNTYKGLKNENALDYGIVTADMVKSGSILNPFKGSVYIKDSKGRTETLSDEVGGEAFIIEYNNLPAEACVTMVTSDWGSAAGSGLIGIAAYGDCNGAVDTTSATCAANNAKAYLNSKTKDETTGNNTVKGSLEGRTITQAVSDPFTIKAAVEACNPTTGTDTSGNASVALKYY